MKVSKLWTVIVALACALSFCTAGVGAAEKGDVVLGIGWAYNAPKADLDVRTGGLVASAEFFLSESFSLRADYFRVRLEDSGGGVEEFLAESESKGFALALSPHLGNLSFPIGLVGVSIDGDNSPKWGGTAGAWLDFWATENIGIGFGASYQYLKNTSIGEDFVDARGALRFKF